MRYTKKNGSNPDAWNWLGYCFRKLAAKQSDPSKYYSIAMKYYNKALKINPSHAGALEYQGELFLSLGQVPNARRNLNQLRSDCKQFDENKQCVSEEFLDLKSAIARYQLKQKN